MNRKLQQEQQGFFPSVPVINCQPIDSDADEVRRPFDYQPRVFLNASIERRLPIEMIEPVQKIPILENCLSSLTDERESGSLLRGQPKSPREKYAEGSAYKLVYAKYGRPPFSNTESTFTKRELELSSILKYDPSKYVTLRQQVIDLQRETVKFQTDSLVFDSAFQSGNLYCVFQSLKEPNTYDCFIESDTNTTSYNQWFYFSIKNMQRSISYKFNLVNMSKRFSFYKMGMKPTFFSLSRFKKQGNGWFQKGHGIKYKASEVHDISQGQKVRLYCLTFEVEFDYDKDYITISHGSPYSYSRLIRQLKSLKNEAVENDIIWNQQTICHTVGNNQVPYLVVSKKASASLQDQTPESGKGENKIIIILARQHSGEINSSFVMEKILRMLSNAQNSKVQWLLNRYQFRIFPMVNVDGVIYGNSRCDLVGFDLNRCWKRPIKQLQPQIFAIKQQIQALSTKNKIVCCIDLHSHSKQLNFFSYCNKFDQIQSRLFSLILSKSSTLFHFPSCTFGLSKEKQSTARSVIGSLTLSENSMTIQSSSFGYKKDNSIIPFSNKSFEDIATGIMVSLKGSFCNNKYRQNMLNEIKQNLFKYRAYCKKNWEVNSGSDSEPNCMLNQLEMRLRSILPNDFIAKICKKFKQENAEGNENRRIQTEVQVSDDQIPQPVKKDKILKILPKRISIDPKQEILKRRQLQALSKKNVDKEVSMELPVPRQHKIYSERTKTEQKATESIPRILSIDSNQESNVRQCSPNKIFDPNQSSFKNSMKILYRELRSNTQQEDHESQLLINYSKQENKKMDLKLSNKLETILRVRRKVNNFKSILSRQRETIQEMPLLKIRSEHASTTVEAISHNISPTLSSNSKIDKLISPKQAFPRDRYVSHIAFLNKFLRNNIKETFRPQQCQEHD